MGLIGNIVGSVKDKASLTKAAFSLSSPTATVTVLKATTHESTTPPSDHHLSALLSLGKGPRTTASSVINALMYRLHHTTSSTVALKCLFTLHLIIRRGSFILHDQLSLYPSYGGRNYLKLSDFRDNSSPLAWEMSAWVRWYAKYIEQILSSCRIIGFFIYADSNHFEREKANDMVVSILNSDLLREIDSLTTVSEEVCRIPESMNLIGNNRLLLRVMELVGEDICTLVEESMIRLVEFTQRLNCLSFSDSVVLVCALKRLNDCYKEPATLSTLQRREHEKGKGIEVLRAVVSELRDKVRAVTAGEEEARKKYLVAGIGSESARFGDRSLYGGLDSVKFSSSRFAVILKDEAVNVSL